MSHVLELGRLLGVSLLDWTQKVSCVQVSCVQVNSLLGVNVSFDGFLVLVLPGLFLDRGPGTPVPLSVGL